MKNIRQFTGAFVTLLMVSFLISPFAFAASDITRDSLLKTLIRDIMLSDVPEKVQQSVSDIVIIYDAKGLVGSGFVVKDKKRNRFLILTAWHVMEDPLKDPEHIKIKHRGEELKIKEILAYSKEQDVFIGVLEDYKGQGLTFAHHPDYNSNEMYILGFPNGRFAIHDGAGIDSKSTPYFGIITDTEKNLGGSSGGPVLNNDAKVIGIHQAEDMIHISRALKSEHFKDLLFGTNTLKADWERAGFIVIEKPFREAIKDIKLPEHYRDVITDHPFSIEDNLPRLKQIADDGSLTAQLRMSWLLDDIDNPFRQDPPQEQIEDAIRYLKMAAQNSHIEAMVSLAERLYEGNGIPQDKLAAAHWFQLIIKNHYRHTYTPTAMLNLAKMLEEGDGISQSKQKAAQLYERVIEKGDHVSAFDAITEAKKRLANILEKEDGVPQDKKRARLLRQEVETQQLEEEQEGEIRLQKIMERVRTEEEKEKREVLRQRGPRTASDSQITECAKNFSSKVEDL